MSVLNSKVKKQVAHCPRCTTPMKLTATFFNEKYYFPFFKCQQCGQLITSIHLKTLANQKTEIL